MDRLVAALSWFVEMVFNAVSSVTGSVVSMFDWPASALGVPAEILAAAALCVALLALWRAMGGFT